LLLAPTEARVAEERRHIEGAALRTRLENEFAAAEALISVKEHLEDLGGVHSAVGEFTVEVNALIN